MSAPLLKIIKAKIRQDGFMNMGEYMALCLGHPEYGYYMTRDPFGADGDFITAPEISQMFGELIGAWLVDSWKQMGSPANFIVLECGAGRGTLMQDALRATQFVKEFHQALHLHLLETSPPLRKAQEERLGQYGASWHMTLETLPVDYPVLILGNEFIDALSVRQLVKTDTGWREKVVILDVNDTLRFGEIEAKKEVESLIPPFLIPPKKGDHVEVSFEQERFLQKVMDIVLKQGGNALFIDYGFVHSLSGDTLQAVGKHQFRDVLDSPGDIDITAHVNFADMSRLGLERKMTVHGPVSQADFLNRIGIRERAQNLTQNATDAQRVEITTALKRLTGKNTKSG